MTEKKNPPLLFQAKVSEFESAREALIGFRNKHSKLIEQHDLLVNAHNSALTEVKAEYKKHHADIGEKYGDFRVSVRTDVDAKKLLELMPNAEAAVKIEYKVDRDEYNKLVKAGAIPQEVVAAVEHDGAVSIYGPKEQ